MDVNYLEVLAKNCWALIPESHELFDDACIGWVVVGFFQDEPKQRVIGETWDESKPELAIEDALNNIESDPYFYLGEFISMSSNYKEN